MPTDKILRGRRLREYRKKKGLTLVELGKKLGISHAALSDIENEKSSPSADTMAALIRETDININWFFAGVGEMINTPIAPALNVIARIIKALYEKEYKTESTDGMPSTVVFSRYVDKVEKELGVMPGHLSASINNPEFDLPHDTIIRFCIRRGISTDWIYTGEGEMLRGKRVKSPTVDLHFLKEIVETIEKVFQKEDLHLSPRKKADLIALLYDELKEEPSKQSLLKGKIIKLVKLAS